MSLQRIPGTSPRRAVNWIHTCSCRAAQGTCPRSAVCWFSHPCFRKVVQETCPRRAVHWVQTGPCRVALGTCPRRTLQSAHTCHHKTDLWFHTVHASIEATGFITCLHMQYRPLLVHKENVRIKPSVGLIRDRRGPSTLGSCF
jgi:hypothetical protein